EEPSCLDTWRPGRADHPGELGRGEPCQSPRGENAARAKGGDGTRRVGPRRVLGEDGARGDLVGRPAGPPRLRAEATRERPVEVEQARLHAVAGRPGDPAPASEGRAG